MAEGVLVTTEWLADHLGAAGVVVAEVDENPDVYDEGHIPGAVKLHWKDDLQDPVERDLVEKDEFERLMGSLGIGNDTTLILLLNDDYTPMEFVVHVLERFFNKSREAATEIMLHVHHRGVGVCGVYTYEVAETKVTQTIDFARRHQHPLQCTMEKE